MLYDKDKGYFSQSFQYRVNVLCDEILQQDIDYFYNSHRLFKMKTYNDFKHIAEWLYNVKKSTESSDLRYCNIILVTLKDTLKKYVTDEQFEICKLLLDIFIKKRKTYLDEQNKCLR